MRGKILRSYQKPQLCSGAKRCKNTFISSAYFVHIHCDAVLRDNIRIGESSVVKIRFEVHCLLLSSFHFGNYCGYGQRGHSVRKELNNLIENEIPLTSNRLTENTSPTTANVLRSSLLIIAESNSCNNSQFERVFNVVIGRDCRR